jgi:PAS domain S-box-containing protein
VILPNIPITTAVMLARHRPFSLAMAIGGVCLALIALVWIATWLVIEHDRRLEIKAKLAENANIARVLDEHAGRTLLNADRDLLNLKHRVENGGLRAAFGPNTQDSGLAGDVVLQVAVVDEHGMLAASSLPFKPVSLADREQFQVHRNNADSGLFISDPVQSRSLGKRAVHLTRRINNRNGTFAGVAAISINPHYFSTFYSRLDLGQEGIAALIGMDKVVRAGYEHGEVVSGSTHSLSDLWTRLEQSSEGTFVEATAGQPHLFAYRKLAAFPLIIVVGTAQSEVLARVNVKAYRAGAAFVTLLILVAGIGVTRMLRRAAANARRLADSEAELSATFNGAAIGMARISLDGNILAANRTLCNMVGYSEDELVGRSFASITFAEDRALTTETIAKLERGETHSIVWEKRYIHKSGSLVCARLTTSIVHSAEGHAVHRLLVAEDITGRKRAEAAIAENRARLSLALTGSSVVIWENDLSIKKAYLSAEASVMMGGPSVETYFDAERLFELVHPSDVPDMRMALASFIRGAAKEYRVQHRLRTKSGAWLWLETSGSVTERDANGRVLKMTGISINITELKRIQSELEQSRRILEQRVAERTDQLARANEQLQGKIAAQTATEKRLSQQLERVRVSEERSRLFASIVEQTRDAIVVRDTDGKIIAWNRAATELFGYIAEEALGQPIGTLHQSNLSPDECREVLERVRSGKRYDQELHRVSRNGTPLELWTTASPIFNAEGDHIGEVAIMRDISERTRQARETAEARAAAEAANRAKSEFLANMSHEIRTPMNGVLGMIELVLRSPLDTLQREYLGLAISSGKALLEVINDVLDFSKIEAGHLHIDAIDYAPAECIAEVVRILALGAREKGLILEWSAAKNVPARVIGDPIRLRQILMNLAGNAIKFTEQGSVHILLRTVEQSADSVVLSVAVRDTGIGIPADKQRIIFDAFTQADNGTSRRYGGTGLGLSISARLAALMGGAITVESTPDEGSTFVVTIRCALEAMHGPAIPVETASQRPESDRLSLRSRKAGLILLVEDNPVNQIVASRMLKHIGHQVVAVGNGAVALDSIAAQRFDLVLMDMQMPVMDGLEATAAIRARERSVNEHIPIVALTANAMDGDRQRCLAAGMDDYLAKPFDLEQLRTVCDLWLPYEELAVDVP